MVRHGGIHDRKYHHAWIDIDGIVLKPLDTANANFVLLQDRDMPVWLSSMRKKKLVESLNKQRLWGSITIAGAVGYDISKDKNSARARALGVGSSHRVQRDGQGGTDRNDRKSYRIVRIYAGRPFFEYAFQDTAGINAVDLRLAYGFMPF